MVYYDSTQGQVAWNEDLNAVVIEWKGFSYGAELQTIMLKGIDLMVVNEADKLLMDARHGAAIKQEDQEWIAHTYVTEAYDAGLRYFAMVLPEKVTAKLSLNRTAAAAGGSYPYELESFVEIQDAKEWLVKH